VKERNDVSYDNARRRKVRTHISDIILSQLHPLLSQTKFFPVHLFISR